MGVVVSAFLASTTALANSALPVQSLQVGSETLQVEVARSTTERSVGLMHRQSLAWNAGMLFEFPTPDVYCFWMKNTTIPLSIAFIGAQDRIISIQDMQPESLQAHCPPSSVQAALEVNQGWFARARVRVGDIVRPAP